MREILFRGKPTEYFEHFKIFRPELFNGDFVYGSLVVCDDRYFICVHAMCSINSCVNNGMTTMVEVIPETIDQFTGFHDYNGKRIFEGDILDRKCPRKHWSNRMYVSWCRGSFILQDFDENEDFLSNWCNTAYRNGEDVGGCYIIGNIHDNAELLKETMKGE